MKAQSIKVIALGYASLGLVDALRPFDEVAFFKVANSSPTQLNASSFLAPLIKGTHLAKSQSMADAISFIQDAETIQSLNDHALAQAREIAQQLEGAQLLIVLLSLDSAMSFASYEHLINSCRSTGACVLTLLAMPFIEAIPSLHQNIITQVSDLSDCVIASEGFWVKNKDESSTWFWDEQQSALEDLLQYATKSRAHLTRLTHLLNDAGPAVYSSALGNTADEALAEALSASSNTWIEQGNTIMQADAGLITLEASQNMLDDELMQLRQTLRRNTPLTDKSPPYWRKADQWLLHGILTPAFEIDMQMVSVRVLSLGLSFNKAC